MMLSKKGQKKNRIPVHFVDDESASQAAGQDRDKQVTKARSGEEDLSSDEIGRQSSYEDETETQRRIDRGREETGSGGRSDADDKDTAGGPAQEDLPEQREDRDEATADGGSSSQEGDAPRPAIAQDEHGPVRAELIATRAELRRVETEREELRDALARRQADFENFRKRVERERTESYNRMVGDVVSKLLPVFDNLRRALDAEGSLQANESEEFRHFLQGIELIYKQLSNVLEGLGLKPVEAVGRPFDPHVHEAVSTEQTDEYEPDTVIQELVPGYRLGEKLLRPAVVKVATR